MLEGQGGHVSRGDGKKLIVPAELDGVARKGGPTGGHSWWAVAGSEM